MEILDLNQRSGEKYRLITNILFIIPLKKNLEQNEAFIIKNCR